MVLVSDLCFSNFSISLSSLPSWSCFVECLVWIIASRSARSYGSERSVYLVVNL